MAKIIQFPGVSDDGDEDNAQALEDDSFSHESYQGLGLLRRQTAQCEHLASLYASDLEKARATLEVDVRITPQDAARVPVLPRVIELLETVRGLGGVKETSAGYLPVAVVKRLTEGAYKPADLSSALSSPKAIREAQFPQLRFERQLLEGAGLLQRKNRRLQLSEQAQVLLSHAGEAKAIQELYAALMRAFLARPTLLDDCGYGSDGGLVSRSVFILLCGVAALQEKLVYSEDLMDLLARVCPSEFKKAVADGIINPLEDIEASIELRFFTVFAHTFGLCSISEPKNSTKALRNLLEGLDGKFRWETHHPWLVSDLVSRVFRFHIDPPQGCTLSDQQAALLLTEIASGCSFEFFAAGYCVRALFRDPHCAEAYIMLASIERDTPELSLRILELGIAEGERLRTGIPPGTAAWADPFRRDDMRLRFARAEALTQLGRKAHAVVEYEQLIVLDPADNLGTRFKLVPLLILEGRVQDAAELLEAFSAIDDAGSSAFTLWNRVLILYAQGGGRCASQALDDALEANDYVADELLYPEPFPEVMPSSFYIGSPEEAMVYAEESLPAWRAVKGARAWLRRRVEG